MAAVDTTVGQKTCTKCGVEKPYEEFHRRANRKHGRVSRCRDCEHERHNNEPAAVKRAQYERTRVRRLDYEREQTYGVSREQYDEMLRRQVGVCAICEQPETSRSKRGETKALAVDHDHDTGVVRGLLCAACNCGLGYFRDDESRLRKATNYLNRSK